MPNYNAQVPPYSIFPGDVAFAFNTEAPWRRPGQPAICAAQLRRISGEWPHGPLANQLRIGAFGREHSAAVVAGGFRRAVFND